MLLIRLKSLLQLLLAVALVVYVVPEVHADSISLSNVTVTVNQSTSGASVGTDLVAHSDTASQVNLDSLTVELFDNGTAVDLSGAGPITLDESGFLSLPLSLADGATASAQPLFSFSGLTAGSYTGDFYLAENITDAGGNLVPTPLESPGQQFAFTVQPSAIPAPEPPTVWLLMGGLALAAGCRFVNGCTLGLGR